MIPGNQKKPNSFQQRNAELFSKIASNYKKAETFLVDLFYKLIIRGGLCLLAFFGIVFMPIFGIFLCLVGLMSLHWLSIFEGVVICFLGFPLGYAAKFALKKLSDKEDGEPDYILINEKVVPNPKKKSKLTEEGRI